MELCEDSNYWDRKVFYPNRFNKAKEKEYPDEKI